MLDIVIIGAGGFGREIYNFARDAFSSDEFRIKGLLDDNPTQLNDFRLDVPIISSIESYSVEQNDRFLIAIGNVEIKRRIVAGLKQRGARFLSLIHPTSYLADTAKIGEGVIICPFCTVSDSAVIDDFVMMHIYSSCGHDATIGKYSILSPYATVNGFSILEENVFMGTHATVTAYRRVGDRAKISANSAAMGDVPPRNLVYGVPGKNKAIFV